MPEPHLFVFWIPILEIVQYHVLQVVNTHSSNQQQTLQGELNHFGNNLPSAWKRPTLM